MSKEILIEKLAPVLDALRSVDLSLPHLARKSLEERFPVDGPWWTDVKALVRQGVQENWLCEKENAGVRFCRIKKSADASDFVIDAVHMRSPGSPHTHPRGEVSACFTVEGTPKFDGNRDGWVVYGPRSWHVPIVSGGVMDIVYFLPGGEMVFGDRPK